MPLFAKIDMVDEVRVKQNAFFFFLILFYVFSCFVYFVVTVFSFLRKDAKEGTRRGKR
jgi:hypothetical protein